MTIADLYFGLKFFIEIAPIITFAALIMVIIIINSIENYKFNRCINYLKSCGFERYLIDVASVGTKAWYGWRHKDGRHISEKDLKHITYKELKTRFPL